MTDPLSVCASIAGLVTIADTVIRNGYKYVKAAKNSKKMVAALINEINLLSGTLHSLQNVINELQSEADSIAVTTKLDHVDSCMRTLEKVDVLLVRFDTSDRKTNLHTIKRQLEWPLKTHETRELISEVARHRDTLSVALQADELSALMAILTRQNDTNSILFKIHRDILQDRMERNAQALDREQKDALRWLSPVALDQSVTQEYNLKIRQNGTWSWFLDETKYQEWKIGARSKLWLHGIRLAYFYCDFKNPEAQDIATILRSLIKQFILQGINKSETGIDALLEFRKTQSQVSSAIPPGALLDLLRDVLRPFRSSSVVVDGLDEIKHSRSMVLEILHAIQTPTSLINYFSPAGARST
ncbi:hypothetical protein LTR10_018903 [Elasticomyces elasticus]|uniref:Fungal N-terminal domain-containing protein n=1 Tax=Exophiala sideris TaxID=1016849 RepID=A0ABR0JIZ9_9EURO|nr:hypothetical protein LTR10_018903 [Elasticomyces elasticus]KAK5034452.1 hypothetical protein LTS07_003373 [Exophiala sideris]KAK5042749.1 hypothetical protein LTR13_001597 [Exophiala sideris]KAK5065832.1 hypothetical protein LTR69_003382 [Exophiala sideris]KAK5185707.1 hypothetical protein LTR44_001756 [Eurotiomycetes sp. CCFEE 6388]